MVLLAALLPVLRRLVSLPLARAMAEEQADFSLEEIPGGAG